MKKFEDIEEKIDKFLETLPCQSNMPFPQIKVERQNLEYANLLLDSFASSADSEIQAITQYIYHSKTINNDIMSKALMCIALVEMHHLDALSELIPLLGGKPFYQNSSFYTFLYRFYISKVFYFFFPFYFHKHIICTSYTIFPS